MNNINTPMSKESIMIIYDTNNIIFEKCELFGDFVLSLLLMIDGTYLGDELTDIKNQYLHFNWCWNKNLSNFKKEGLVFENDSLYEYFLNYSLEFFYSSLDKDDPTKDVINIKMWEKIFDYNKLKTHSEVDMFIEIYKLIDNSLKSF